MTILGLVGDCPRDRKNPRFFLENIGTHTLLIGLRIGVGTPHSIERKILAAGGSVRAGAGAGRRKFCQIIMPLRGSILQAETCHIFSFAENPRWSRVWQHLLFGKRVRPHSASHVLHFPLSRKLALKLSKFGLFENTIIEYQMCFHKLFRLFLEEQFFTDRIS